MAPIISRIDSAGNTNLGEGPHWDGKTKSLYFVDIISGTIHKYSPATNTNTKATIKGHEGKPVSLIIPIKDQPNKFVISVEGQLGVASWNGKTPTADFESLATVNATPDVAGTRINDAKCDAKGRIWFGTIGIQEDASTYRNNGLFYSFSDGKITQHFKDVRISNGLVWNKSNTKFYYIDTPTERVDVFDFDLASGSISNRRPFAEVANIGFGPDGMTIDTEDNLWVAVFNGSCVVQLCGKTGKLMQKLDLPAKQITSVAWGGDNLDELYVTCARVDNTLAAPVHGAIYKIVNTGYKGFPMTEAVL